MPDQHPSAVNGVLRRPISEQAAFFRQKLGRQVPTERWDDLTRAEHDTAFVVAGAQKADLLSDLAASVDRAVVEGKSLGAFRKDFDAAVARNGWHGWTGESSKGGRAWRTRTIYRTNAATSYAAGRRAQLLDGKFPLWVYRHGDSREPRPEHLELDGLCLPPEHAFWDTYFGPSDWGCSCYVLGARSARAARRLGGNPDATLPSWWNTIDPATGAPPGVGRGWDYAPGASVSGAVRAAAAKVGSWDHQITKAFLDELPDATRDTLARSYRQLPSVADDARRYARRVLGEGGEAFVEQARTIGILTSEEVATIGRVTGQATIGYDLTISRDAILHVQRRHGVGNERMAGQRGVAIADYARLVEVLTAPDSVTSGEQTSIGLSSVIFTRRIGGETYVAVFEVLGKRRRSLTLKTFYIRVK